MNIGELPSSLLIRSGSGSKWSDTVDSVATTSGTNNNDNNNDNNNNNNIDNNNNNNNNIKSSPSDFLALPPDKKKLVLGSSFILPPRPGSRQQQESQQIEEDSVSLSKQHSSLHTSNGSCKMSNCKTLLMLTRKDPRLLSSYERLYQPTRINRYAPDNMPPKRPSWGAKPVKVFPSIIDRPDRFDKLPTKGTIWCNYLAEPMPIYKLFSIFHSAVLEDSEHYYSGNQVLNCFHVFSRGSVFVTYSRFAQQIRMMGISEKLREADCKWLFNFFDLNKDGEIGFTDFCKQWNRSLLMASDSSLEELYT